MASLQETVKRGKVASPAEIVVLIHTCPFHIHAPRCSSIAAGHFCCSPTVNHVYVEWCLQRIRPLGSDKAIFESFGPDLEETPL